MKNFIKGIYNLVIIAMILFTAMAITDIALEDKEARYQELISYAESHNMTNATAIKQLETIERYQRLIRYTQSHGLTGDTAIKQLDHSERYRRLIDLAYDRNITEDAAIARIRYVVTRDNCHQRLTEYMQTNHLTAKDVAKQIDCRLKTIVLVSQRKMFPTDEMIAKVEALLIVGPSDPVSDAPAQLSDIITNPIIGAWQWTKLYLPGSDNDLGFVIH